MKFNAINSCIDQLRKMLEDSNSELSSEQQRKLKQGVKELKQLKRAEIISFREVQAIVSRIAADVVEILNSHDN
jgi:predicted lipase